jgi:hypothetical protein
MLEMFIIRNDYEVDADEKKPVSKHAKNLEKIAGLWDVKLSKDFAKQAEAYQAELDVLIKELTAQAAPKKAKK